MSSDHLPIIRPDISFAEVEDDVRAILASGMLTDAKFVRAFEQALAKEVGVRHAIATTSATTALHLVLASLGIGPGDEVLVSDFTFPATGNVVVQIGATPVFVDIKPDGYDLDPSDLEARLTDRTAAIIVVDPFGQPADLDLVTELARDRGLPVIEDAACALGASIENRRCGSWPIAGCFSFHPRKVITTGEGGAVTTSDDHLAERLSLLRNHGGVPTDVGMRFLEPGFNYRMSEIPAALGLAQLRRLESILEDRRATARQYAERLADLPEVTIPNPGTRKYVTYQSFVVSLDPSIDRNAVVKLLGDRGIESTLGTYALHTHPAFERCGYRPGQLPRSYAAQLHTLTLPLLPRMRDAQIERVVDELVLVLESARP